MNKRYINIVAKSWKGVTAIVLQCASWTDFSCKRSPGGGGGAVTCVGALHPNLSGEESVYATIQTLGGTIKFNYHGVQLRWWIFFQLRFDILQISNRGPILNVKGGFSWFFILLYVRYSTVLHLPPLKFHCVRGWGDQTHRLLLLSHWQPDAL